MARIRTIKPEFFTSEDIVSLSPLARLLYIALWREADKEGRLVWKPLTFKLRYLPGDSCDIHALCKEILDRGLVCLYGDGLAKIPTFKRHQAGRPSTYLWNAIRARIFKRDNYTCTYCGKKGKRLECDHIVPVSRGGDHVDDNLTTSCFDCNRSKNDKLISEWRPHG